MSIASNTLNPWEINEGKRTSRSDVDFHIVCFLMMGVILFRQFDAIISFINILYMLCVFGVGYKKIKGGAEFGLFFSIRSVLYTFILFLLSESISALLSNYQFYAFYNIIKEAVFLCLMMVLFLILYNDRKKILIIFRYLEISIYIASASILFEFIWLVITGTYDPISTKGRLTGLYENANAPGQFLSIATPLVISFLFSRKEYLSGYKIRIFSLFSVTFIAIALTISRGEFLGFFITSIFIYFTNLTKKQIAKNVTVGVIIIIFLFALILNYIDIDSLLLLIRVENGLSGREELWESGLKMFKSNPIFGIGPHVFNFEFIGNSNPAQNIADAKIINEDWIRMGQIQLHNSSHNLTLDLLATTGLMGLITFAIFIFTTIKKQCYLLKKSNPADHRLFIGCTMVIIIYLVKSQVETGGLLGGAISTNIPLWMALILPFTLPPYSAPLLRLDR